MTASILLFVNERVRNSLEDSHRQWSVTLSHTLAEATVNKVVDRQQHQVRETLRRTTRSDPRVAYIIITDFKGEVFAHTFDEALPGSLIMDENPATDAPGNLVRDVNFRGMNITETTYSLIEGLNAQIRIGIDRSSLRETIKATTKGILLVGVIILVLGLTVSIVLAHKITWPIRSLSKAMQSYAAGDQIQLPEFKKLDSDTKKLVNRFEEMIRLKSQAEEAVKRSYQLAAAGQMASGIAHEINNPLATILACAEVIEKNADAIVMESPHRQKLLDYIQLIQEESTRAAGIIKDMLDFTRDKPLALKKIVLCDVIKRTVHLFEVQSRYEKYNFHLSFAEELPKIDGDSDRIRQVVIVLLTNAVESMPDGGMISVSCEWNSKEEFVILKVSDGGVGIAEDKQREIFEPFYTSKTEGMGSGLGLSIAQDIVEKHNGVMEVQSSPGEGSTLSVKFPCVNH
jgi:two-component system NtrC family sensor kinase